MKCQNCGKNNANVKYTQIINGEKKEFILCEECAEKLGINNKIHFDMNMNFGSILGDFFDEYKSNYGLLGDFPELEPERCEKCGMTYEQFINEGKFGCDNCYNVFSNKIDGVLKNIQGANIHTGRKGKRIESKVVKKDKKEENKEDKTLDLKEKLNKAIKEERYEDAAKIRDEIKKVERNDK